MPVDKPSGIGFVQAMTALFGETAIETKEYVDKLVLEKTGTLKEELLKEIDLNEGDVTALQNAMKAFYDAVDAADSAKDGTTDLAGTFTSIFAKIGLNESNHNKLESVVSVLETTFNEKVSALKKAGEDIALVLSQVKANLENSITDLTKRVSDLELRMTANEKTANAAYTFAEGVSEGVSDASTSVKTTVRGVYGL